MDHNVCWHIFVECIHKCVDTSPLPFVHLHHFSCPRFPVSFYFDSQFTNSFSQFYVLFFFCIPFIATFFLFMLQFFCCFLLLSHLLGISLLQHFAVVWILFGSLIPPLTHTETQTDTLIQLTPPR